MAADETLRTWGKGIRDRRLGLDAEGMPIMRRKKVRPMTAAQLGALLNPPVNQSTVNRWERGIIEPSRHNKAELGRVLFADVAVLFPLTRSVAVA